MGGILLLLALCVVMAVTSFLAGALPLSMTLSQSQLRLISSLGIGILVGTSLIVIIPEGIEAVATTSVAGHTHAARQARSLGSAGVSWGIHNVPEVAVRHDTVHHAEIDGAVTREVIRAIAPAETQPKRDEAPDKAVPDAPHDGTKNPDHTEPATLPTFFIGFALMTGFVLMFLVDRLPRHATENFQSAPATRHISLDNLEQSSSANMGDESESFLGSLAPTPRQSRSLATTTGLVIHAAADGIAMGASATTEDMKLGFIIFVAIMVHKAPAAFGLTSVLLKQGLSKRAARGHLIVFSLAAPFGALATYLIVSLIGGKSMEGESGQWWTGMLLLFSAGTFLYVAMHAMQEDGASSGHEHNSSMNGYSEGNGIPQRKQTKPQMRDTVATVVGMLLPLFTQFGHHH